MFSPEKCILFPLCLTFTFNNIVYLVFVCFCFFCEWFCWVFTSFFIKPVSKRLLHFLNLVTRYEHRLLSIDQVLFCFHSWLLPMLFYHCEILIIASVFQLEIKPEIHLYKLTMICIYSTVSEKQQDSLVTLTHGQRGFTLRSWTQQLISSKVNYNRASPIRPASSMQGKCLFMTPDENSNCQGRQEQ